MIKKIGIGLLLCIFIFGIGLAIKVGSLIKPVLDITIDELAIPQDANATIEGMYYASEGFGATVSVTVVDGEIVAIDIIDHLYGLGGKAEQITETIIQEQSIEVDDVAGATASSRVLKIAVSNAMEELQ